MEIDLESSTDPFTKAFQSRDRVQGLTHDFYKYPARFNPKFVRFILDELSEPGDWVLDPFMGGGTTVVESLSSGRCAVGSDVNELARFVTRVKTTPLSRQDISEIRAWVEAVMRVAIDRPPSAEFPGAAVRNLPPEVIPFFAAGTHLAEQLRFRRRRSFARCALVRVGQWALDARSVIPGIPELSNELDKRVGQMVQGIRDFVDSARSAGTNKNKVTGLRRLRAYSAADPRFANNLQRGGIRPKLVLTSPPYPGVHMLYHRWQIFGRRETPAPYWIAALRDGYGESHYTMGGRSALGLRKYFDTLLAACPRNTVGECLGL